MSSSSPVVARSRIHANGAVTSFLELRYDPAGWSTARYWIDELSRIEERGDRREFATDEHAARADFEVRSREGLTAPIPVSTAPSLLDLAERFDRLLDRRRAPSGSWVELRSGPEGLAIFDEGELRAERRWTLWGDEQRAAADTFRRLAAGLDPMPPVSDTRFHRYPALVERVELGREGAVICALELREGRRGWAITELREYPPDDGWAPERIEWSEYAEETVARAALVARRYRRGRP